MNAGICVSLLRRGSLGTPEFAKGARAPSHHRVHHGRNEQYLDKNYGGITIIWDRLFGTFEEENEKVDYGLVKQLESHNMLWINTHEFVSIARDLKNSRNWKDAAGYLLGKPGWTPASNSALCEENDSLAPHTA